MRISVIVPAYNAAKTIKACLEACRAQSAPPAEIIVVDDASTDATGEIVRAFSDVHYLCQEHRGPAAARNLGAKAASGELIAFTDADCIPHTDWLERLQRGFVDARVAAVGGTYGIANPEYSLARIIHAEIRARHRQLGAEVDFLGSFNVAYRKKCFDAAQGFDEGFSMASAEDNDLAYRLQDAGGALRFIPDAIVDHHHPYRLLPYLRTQMRHGYWRVRLYQKHRGRVSRGDQYAGLGDLLAPPLAVAAFMGALFLTVLAGLGAHLLVPAAILTLVFLAYIAIRASLAFSLLRAQPNGIILGYLLVSCLRDIARGAGLGIGLFRFRGLRGGRGV